MNGQTREYAVCDEHRRQVRPFTPATTLVAAIDAYASDVARYGEYSTEAEIARCAVLDLLGVVAQW
jgi:hypothetical protein